MAADTLTTAAALLKNVYLPGVREFVNHNRPLFKKLERVTDKKRFSGSQFVINAEMADVQSVGAVGEGEVLPVAGNVVSQQMTVGMKYHYAVIRMTAQLLAQASGSNPGAFASAMSRSVGSAKQQLEEDIAIATVYGTGAGDIGTVSAYSSTTLTTKRADTTVGAPGTDFLRDGMTLSSYSALTGGSQGADHKTVTTVTGLTTATVPASAGFNANDYLFRSVTAGVDPRNKSMMGLGGIVDDGTRVGTFQGLSRTTYPRLKAGILGNSGVLRAWSPTLMNALAATPWKHGYGGGGGMWPDAFVSKIEYIHRAAEYISQDRRAPMSTMKLDNGYEQVCWTTPDGEKPWMADQFVRPNEILAVRLEDLGLAILADVQWEENDGSMWRYTDRTHTREAWLYTFRNLFAYQCNNMAALQDISSTL